MPRLTIPLVGELTQRGAAKSITGSDTDQEYINCLFEISENKQLGSKNVYAIKRTGSTTSTTFPSEPRIMRGYSSAFGSLYQSGVTIYNSAAVSLGVISDSSEIYSVSDTVSNSQDLVFFVDGAGAGWFLYEDAVSSNFPTFTGDTHTSTLLDNLANTTGMYIGQAVTGSGFQAGTRIATVGTTSVTLTLATTTSLTATTVTKEALAKIIDADFPVAARYGYECLDGYLFVATPATSSNGGRIYNSIVNNPASWSAEQYISVDYSADSLGSIFKYGQLIVACGGFSTQVFEITGNTSGSVLSRIKDLTVMGGTYSNKRPLYFEDGKIYLIGTFSTGGNAIFRMDGPSTFTPIVDDITQQVMKDSTMDKIGSAIIGNKHVLLAHSTSNGIVYDPTNGMCNLLFFSGGSGQLTSSFLSSFTKSGVVTRFSWSTGNTYQDSSVSIITLIQTIPNILNNGMGFTVNRVHLLADNQASGTTTLETSGDDYATWVTRGTFDMTQTKKKVDRGGFYKNSCAFRLTHSANTAWRGQAIVVYWEPAVT